ncbi:MAG: TusE/DsrC/DsvC family sulfur relay protein [Gammaproteobacteria bacterium]
MSNDITENVQLDADGFLVDPTEWSQNVAFELASSAGIRSLSPNHWAVIESLRERYQAGDPDLLPRVDTLCARLGLGTHCVSDLFGDPKVAWQIAGLPKAGIDMSAYMPTSECA